MASSKEVNTEVTEFVRSEMENPFDCFDGAFPSKIVNQPFILMGIEPVNSSHFSLLAQTNRGKIYGIEECSNVSIDELRSNKADVIKLKNNVCAIRCTHRYWTGMYWDKTYELMDYTEEV